MALKTEVREVHDFSEVALQGVGELVIEQDPGGVESLTIEADSEILPRLSSRVEGGRLILGFDMPWYEWLGWGLEWLLTPNKTIRYHLKARTLNSIALSGAAELTTGKLSASAFSLMLGGAGRMRVGELEAATSRITISGAGNITVDKLQAKTLLATISGTGEVVLAGTSSDAEVHLSGAGSLKAYGLEVQTARLSISGAGGAEITAQQALGVSISGAGEVKYRGAAQASQTISGVGKVVKTG
jgi:hypothetical protein